MVPGGRAGLVAQAGLGDPWGRGSWGVAAVVATPRATCPSPCPSGHPLAGCSSPRDPLEVSVVSPLESCSPCPDGTRGRAACAAPVLPCLAAAHTPWLSSLASSRCFLGFGSGCAHNIFSPVPAAFCARVPRGGGFGGGRVKRNFGEGRGGGGGGFS